MWTLVVIAGLVLTAAVMAFWDEIREWLNNTAADVVQKYISYDARKAMQRAICKADRVINKVRNKSRIYFRKNRMDTTYEVVTTEMSAPVQEFDNDFLNNLQQQKELIQQFDYKG